MPERTQWRLARASRDWFSGTELSSSVDTYARYLSKRGYSHQTLAVYLECVAHFAHWSARQRIGLAEINEGAVDRFLKQHLPHHPSAQTIRPRCAILNRQPLFKGAVYMFPICDAERANIAVQFSCVSRGLQ